MPRLVLRNAILDDHVHPLVPGITLIGRSPECTLTVLDAGVSRFHSRVEWSGAEVTIEDLGSSNGTYVNDEPLAARRTLAHGDVLRIGTVTARFEADAVPSIPTISASPGGSESGAPVREATQRRTSLPRLLTTLAILVLGGSAVWASLAILDRRQRDAELRRETHAVAPAPVAIPPLEEEGDPAESEPTPPASVPPLPISRPTPPPEEPPLRLELSDGTRVQGRLIEENVAAILLLDPSSRRPRRIPKEEIRVRDGTPQIPEWDAIFAARLAEASDLAALSELLRWCQRHGRTESAVRAATRVIELNPSDAVAAAVLGRFRYRGKDWSREDLAALGALGPGGDLEGTDQDLARLRRVFTVALGHPPTAADVAHALPLAPEAWISELLGRAEFWQRRLDPIAARLGPRRLEPVERLVATLAQRCADAESTYVAAVHELCASEIWAEVVPDPARRAANILSALLGLEPAQDPLLFGEAARMVAGERVAVFGERGSDVDALTTILMRQPDYFRHTVSGLSGRLLTEPPSDEDLARRSFTLGVDPDSLNPMLMEWISAAWPETGSPTPLRKTPREVASSLWVLIVGSPPRDDWLDAAEEYLARTGCADVAQPALASLIAATRPAPGPSEEATAAWIHRQHRQALGRSPRSEELEAFRGLLTSGNGSAARALATFARHPEFQHY